MARPAGRRRSARRSARGRGRGRRPRPRGRARAGGRGGARGARAPASLSISRWEREADVLRTMINVGDLGPGEERFPDDEIYQLAEDPAARARCSQTGNAYFNAVDDPDVDPAARRRLRRSARSPTSACRSWSRARPGARSGRPPRPAAALPGEDVRFLEAIAGQLAGRSGAPSCSRTSRGSPTRTRSPASPTAARSRSGSSARSPAHGGDGPAGSAALRRRQAQGDQRRAGHDAGDRALRARGRRARRRRPPTRPGSLRRPPRRRRVLRRARGPRALDDARGARPAAALAHSARAGGRQPSARSPAARRPLGRGVGRPAELLRAADAALYRAKRAAAARSAPPAPGLGRAPRRRAARAAAHDASERVRDAVQRADRALRRRPGRRSACSTHRGRRRALRRGAERRRAGRSPSPRRRRHASTTVSLGRRPRPAATGACASSARQRGLRARRLPGHRPAHRAPERARSSSTSTTTTPTAPSATLLERRASRRVAGAAAADEDGIYLLELVRRRRHRRPLDEATEPALRLAARRSLPRPPRRRTPGCASAATATRSRSRCALGRGSPGATDRARAICEAAAEELQRAFGCRVVACSSRSTGDDCELARRARARAADARDCEPSRRPRADRPLRCARARPVMAADVPREPHYARPGPPATSARSWRCRSCVGGEPGARSTSRTRASTPSTRTTPACSRRSPHQLGGALRRDRAATSSSTAPTWAPPRRSGRASRRKDSYTAEHSRSIAEQRARPSGGCSGMDEPTSCARCATRPRFHDIGKLGDPRGDPQQARPADDEERAEIEQHTVIGERILAPIEFLAPIRPLVRARPRALGRRRLSRRAGRRGDPARRADPVRLRRLRRDDHATALTAARWPAREARAGSCAGCAGTPVRSARGRRRSLGRRCADAAEPP